MVQLVEEIECLGDIGYVDAQAKFLSALAEGTRLATTLHPGSGKLVDRLTEPDMPFMAKAFGSRQHIVIQPQRGSHTQVSHR